MELHFESDLDYQIQAIEAVCDLFRGQELFRTEFTILGGIPSGQTSPLSLEGDLGVGNQLQLSDDEILKNLSDVQRRHGLPLSPTLQSREFTVEMETGTGKTYVYLRTIFELHKRYGFTKFIIVVPSIAIREGVYKTLRITEAHLRGLYGNAPFEYFLYDSAKLGRVRSFATSLHIEIMIVTVGAINKKEVNNLYKDTEKTGGETPIDLIKQTHPILIVDEPQSVDGGLSGRGREALRAMGPLCTLRYSATHVVKHHMVYRLDAVDAYERRLVKQIEVASATVEGAHNQPFVRFIEATAKRGAITARVVLDVDTGTGVQREQVEVRDGDVLERIAKRAIYRDCRIGEIRIDKGHEFMELRVAGAEYRLRPGEAWADVDAAATHRQMIRRTIQEHLSKAKRLGPRGIKVLSLFFVDSVEKYRKYDSAGNPVKGEYALIFEEEYQRLSNHPEYGTTFGEMNARFAPEQVHGGYFSIDRRGRWSDTAENNQVNRDNAERAYSLIMKDKEQLLSLETPLQFIFSHSALREGWDNPNVFQICTLRNIQAERERRQTIGRGLRLAVNQNGDRVRDDEVNTLTVIATESYEEFAENLQKEIESDTGIRFGKRMNIRNADKRVETKTQGVGMADPEFQALWEQIEHKTLFNVQFDNEKLIRDSTHQLRRIPPLTVSRLRWKTAGILIGKSGIDAVETRDDSTAILDDTNEFLPDVLTDLQERTNLTRRTVFRILSGSHRLHDCRRNPQQFIEMAAQVMNRCKRLALAQGIKYERVGDDPYYVQELVGEEELAGPLKKMLMNGERSASHRALCDSDPKFEVARWGENHSVVKIYELPEWFCVSTPIGNYSPDWAISMEGDDSERLYLLTKSGV